MIKYTEVIYDLRDSGFSIYIMDHRGQGFSGRMLKDSRKGHVADFNEYLIDLKTFVDTVVTAGQDGRVFLLGHSMGGAIAALYTARYPKDINGLILCAPMFAINSRPLPEFTAALLVKTLIAMGQGNNFIPGGKLFDPYKAFDNNILTSSQARFSMCRKLLGLHPQTVLGSPTNRWILEALKACEAAKKAASDIKHPILLLQAQKDALVTSSGQDEFCRQAPNCTPISFADARHEILMEQDPIRDRALTEISDFLNRHT